MPKRWPKPDCLRIKHIIRPYRISDFYCYDYDFVVYFFFYSITIQANFCIGQKGLTAWVGIVCVIISLIKYEKSHRKHSREWSNTKLNEPTAFGANHRGVCLWYWIKWLRYRNVNRNSGFMNNEHAEMSKRGNFLTIFVYDGFAVLGVNICVGIPFRSFYVIYVWSKWLLNINAMTNKSMKFSYFQQLWSGQRSSLS